MPVSRVADPQPFEVRGSAIQGRGGFATRPIARGECIVEYVGERISWKEADRRYDDAGMKRHHTFLFSVTSRTCIDAAVGGNDSRFINHSCDPNCEAVDERGRIFIFAKRDIAEGEELAYDYAYERDPAYTEEDEALYVCRCGSPKCRGTILAPVGKTKAPKRHAAARRSGGGKSGKGTKRRGVGREARGKGGRQATRARAR
jgi:SET domain-containing protein